MKPCTFWDEAVEDLRTYIGHKIRELRKARNLKQGELAEMIGCDTPLISRYERGATLPSIEQLIKLSTALDSTPSELLPSNANSDQVKMFYLRKLIEVKLQIVNTPENLKQILDLVDKLVDEDFLSEKA
jgi:transcriptional regulator with XRE-family HTH domain